MTCGIYQLTFKGTNMCYIGQSSNIEARFRKHLSTFASGSHTKKLSEAYQKYGVPTLVILTICEEAELDSFEKEVIDIFDAINSGFNSCEVDSTPTLRGELHGMSRYTNEQIVKVFNTLIETPELSLIEVSSILGVSKYVVSDVSSGKTHTWLRDIYPEKYAELMSLKHTRNSNRKEQLITRKYPDITCPEGIVYSVTNASKFAREHGLHASNLLGVLNGTAKSIKGWKLSSH